MAPKPIDESVIQEAVKRDDIAWLRTFLDQNPEYLEAQMNWGKASGHILGMAASFDRPKVIEFLVNEKGMSVDQREKASAVWVALHFACHAEAYAAVEKLIELGADPTLKEAKGRTPRDYTSSVPILEMLDAATADCILNKSLQKQAPDEWSLPSPAEVMHRHGLAGTALRLTDVFNFETRCWQAIVQDGKALARNILFFDDLADRTVLHQAHAEYAALGGEIGADVIDRQPLRGKIIRRSSGE